jgi:NlpC/P60 family putative phage cell wall peptidase
LTALLKRAWQVPNRLSQPAPAYSRDWAEASGQETLANAARAHLTEIDPRTFQPGDVLLFRYRPSYPAKHAAIVSAPELMVHAHDGAVVSEVAIAPWWRRRLAYAFRFPGVID